MERIKGTLRVQVGSLSAEVTADRDFVWENNGVNMREPIIQQHHMFSACRRQCGFSISDVTLTGNAITL
jgi:hypothetical protein